MFFLIFQFLCWSEIVSNLKAVKCGLYEKKMLVKIKFGVGFISTIVSFVLSVTCGALLRLCDKLVIGIRDVTGTSLNICFKVSLIVYKLT